MDKPLALQTTTQVICKEGRKPILLCVALIFLFIFIKVEVLAVFFLAVLVILLFIFRNQERITESRNNNAIIAPCDGRIEDISRFDGAIIIKIRVNVFDVGIFRAPMCADKIITNYKYGLFFGDDENFKETLNTRHNINGMRGNEIFFSMTLLPEIWNKISVYAKDSIFAGDRLGFMKYGYIIFKIHKQANIKVKVGQNIFAGQTLIGIYCED